MNEKKTDPLTVRADEAEVEIEDLDDASAGAYTLSTAGCLTCPVT
ncbi:hypothetical protein [Streptomyces bambusae]|nr:hypothetical protein [Streptomyces bambusae]